MGWLIILCAALGLQAVFGADTYELYSGKPISNRRRSDYEARNVTTQCTIQVEPCDPQEGRRVDGTCNNPKHPTRGATFTPMKRLLPADTVKSRNPYLSKSGYELPLVREIRTAVFSDGIVISPPFTALATHFFVHSSVDIVSIADLLTYMIVSDCCLGNRPNRANPRCIPIEVPSDDPYLRLTGIRCMNLTRNTAYQDVGCVPDAMPRDRMSSSTPLQDLSIIYGNDNLQSARTRNRTDGLLRYEIRNNRTLPPGRASFCLNNNRLLGETQCNEYGDPLNGNALVGINIIAIWFYREHNRIATELKRVNPCWDDDKLFKEARNINIAQWQHIYFYELIPAMLGYENVLHSGIIHKTDGYVNDYDPSLEPALVSEFIVGTRWFHTFQDDRTKRYSQKLEYLGNDVRQTEHELRSGALEVNRTLEELTAGAWIQEDAKFDYIFDPALTERLFPLQQAATDLIAIDFMRGRDAALQPYNEYRQLCGLPRAIRWDDFLDTIDKNKVESLSQLYDEPDDVDFAVGIYAENFIKGGWVGPTLYCIMEKQLLHWRKSDRFFYEHGDQPASLTLKQLNEIRKASIARVLCDSGDEVTRIQPHAFWLAKEDNKIVSCNEIENWDVKPWADPKCNKNVTFQDGALSDPVKKPDVSIPEVKKEQTIPMKTPVHNFEDDSTRSIDEITRNVKQGTFESKTGEHIWSSKPKMSIPSYNFKNMVDEQLKVHGYQSPNYGKIN